MNETPTINLKSRVQKQQKKKIRKIRFYHSFLTILLILLVLEIGYSSLLNLAKIVFYRTKISKAQELKVQAEARNAKLKNEIKNFSSMYKVESIARNNLKMAARDEVLIIINQPSEVTSQNKRFDNKFTRFLEGFARNFNKEDIANEKLVD